jgi:hypothetical protein
MCIGLVGNFTVCLAREGSIYEFLYIFSFSFDSKYCDENTDTNTNTHLHLHKYNKLTELSVTLQNNSTFVNNLFFFKKKFLL